MITSCAPVLIITLDRFEKLKLCLESLGTNQFANQTDLYIALDYPSKPEHFEGYNKIVSLVDTLSGFKTVNIIKRKENFGIIQNYLQAKNELFGKYDRIIFSEDDNEFSSDFLNFMNICLTQFKDDKTIFSVSGYNYPTKMPPDYNLPIYKWNGHSAWGFGIWKDRWEQISWQEDKIFSITRDFLKKYRRVYKYHLIANHYLSSVLAIAANRKLNGDGFINLFQFENRYYSIFPTQSRVRNHGHDGSGRSQSTIARSPYSDQEIYSGTSDYVIPTDIRINIQVNTALRNHFKVPIINRIRLAVKLILFNMGLLKVKV
jgi:hypothetical protein